MRVGTSLCFVIAASAACTRAARAQTRAAPSIMSDSTRDPFARLPQYFELTDTALAAPLDGWYALHPTTLQPPKKMFATWHAVDRDSVEVGWSNGFTGLSLSLVARGDTLTGFVERTSDAHPRGSVPVRRPVMAKRVACRPR